MNNNEIKCAIEDAWKEFERTGEITNGASNLLSAVTALQTENEELTQMLKNYYFPFKPAEKGVIAGIKTNVV